MLLRVVVLLFLGQAALFAQSADTDTLKSNYSFSFSDSTISVENPKVSKAHSLNGVQHKKDTVVRKLDSLNAKAVQLQNYTRNKFDSVSNGINQSTELIDSKTKGIVQKVSTSMQIQHPDVHAMDIPSTSIPDIGSVVSTDVNLTSDSKIPAITEAPLNPPDLSAIKQTLNVDEITDLNENIPDISGGLTEVREYEDNLQKIKESAQQDPNKLSELAEQKVSEMYVASESTQAITKATEEQAKYEAMIQRYRDQKLIQEEINRKYKAVANDYIMQQTEKLNAARDKLNISKYKKHDPRSVKEVFRKQSDELEGKKFYQRLVPGINWQIYNKGFASSDISLQVGYRLTPRLTSGIGGVYRVGFDKKFGSFVKGMNTFGGRVYADMVVVKGLFLHGEFEALRQDRSYTVYVNETVSRRVYESNFGLGKRFNISRSIRGGVLAIYRVEYDGALPAANKVNVRMGIEYVFRRTKKKLNGL